MLRKLTQELSFQDLTGNSSRSLKHVDTECICSIRGDPHVTPFNGDMFDFGGAWTNMVKTADCNFNVQTFSISKISPNEKAAIRFYNDTIFVLWNHGKQRTSGAFEVVHSSLSAATVESKHKKDSSLSWTNDDVGCTVTVSPYHRVKVACKKDEYSGNFGGYCGACDNGEGNCGVNEIPWNIIEGDEMWMEGDEVNTKKCVVNGCTSLEDSTPVPPVDDRCVDQETGYLCDANVDTDATCQLPLNGIEKDLECRVCDNKDCTVEGEICRTSLDDGGPRKCRGCDDSDCDDGNKCKPSDANPQINECRPIDKCFRGKKDEKRRLEDAEDAEDKCTEAEKTCEKEEKITVMKGHCQELAIKKWWMTFCECAVDYCNLPNIKDDDKDAIGGESPCLQVTPGQSKTIDGKDYATLISITSNDDTLTSRPVLIPTGFEVCSDDDENILEGDNGNPVFPATECVVTMKNHVGTCDDNWTNKGLIKTIYNQHSCASVDIDAKICIVRTTA